MNKKDRKEGYQQHTNPFEAIVGLGQEARIERSIVARKDSVQRCAVKHDGLRFFATIVLQLRAVPLEFAFVAVNSKRALHDASIVRPSFIRVGFH